MTIRLPVGATVAQAASKWLDEAFSPALTQLAGADRKLSKAESTRGASLEGAAKLAADDVEALFGSGSRALSVTTMRRRADTFVTQALTAAAGADGVLQQSELAALGRLSQDFSFELGSSAPAREIGIVSDLDDTVIPKTAKDDLDDPPFPGVAALYRALELGAGGQPGDVHFVTARKPERIEGISAYLERNGVPAGGIDTGVSSLPWVAQPEKVRDIVRVLEANPGQRFVFFGDSSHVDPEVYGEVLRRFPERVAAVFIHQVNRTVKPERVAGLHLIQNYAEAAAILAGKGVLTADQARDVMAQARTQGLALSAAEADALLAKHAARPS